MMQAFRNSAKPIVLILTVSFLAWLVFDLSGLSGGSGLLTQTSVGKINGRTIDARVFQEAVQQATQAQQQQSSGPLGVAATAQIRDQVWEQFIQSTILETEYGRRKLQVSAAEIAETIRNIPPPEVQQVATFQTDGRFDMSKYQAWLTTSEGQSFVPALEARYRDEILRTKLVQELVSDLYVSNAFLWQRYQDEHDSVSIGLATLDPPTLVSDASAPVSDDEVDEYFRAHRSDFERKATAFMSFIVLDKSLNQADTTAALTRAQGLRQEIVDGGPFEEVAQRESADTVSGNRGGDLGEWTRGSFDADFEKVAFSLPLNTVSEPVLTPFGYHLIEVTARKGDKATARHILIRIELAGAHRDFVDAQADSLENLAAERLDRAALDTAARALNVPIQHTGPVIESGLAQIHEDAAVWAFQATSGELSPVMESATNFFVYRVDSLWAAGVPPITAIRQEVIIAVRLEKKRTVARRLATDLKAQVVGGVSLDAAATGIGASYRPLGPFTKRNAPVQSGWVVGAAFGIPVGSVSDVLEDNGAFHLVQVTARTKADSADFAANIETQRRQVLQALRQNYVQQYFTSLRTSARLVDRRADLYKTNAQAEAAASQNPVGF